MQVKKTNNYSMFKFRTDNRAEIRQHHVNKLKASILQRNMLDLRPITVNDNFEVMDGQHRLKAAQQLGVDIYYTVDDKATIQDLLLMNVNLQWSAQDYLNYYCKNGYMEYIKLKRFMEEKDLHLYNALECCGKTSQRKVFNSGQFQFSSFDSLDLIERIKETIDFIKMINGANNNQYTRSCKFWRPLKLVMNHHSFNYEKWKRNLEINITKIGPRGTTKQYLELFQDIYNYRNKETIEIDEAELRG